MIYKYTVAVLLILHACNPKRIDKNIQSRNNDSLETLIVNVDWSPFLLYRIQQGRMGGFEFIKFIQKDNRNEQDLEDFSFSFRRINNDNIIAYNLLRNGKIMKEKTHDEIKQAIACDDCFNAIRTFNNLGIVSIKGYPTIGKLVVIVLNQNAMYIYSPNTANLSNDYWKGILEQSIPINDDLFLYSRQGGYSSSLLP